MINGDINAFIEVAQYGHEVFFLYKGQKFFLQGMGPSVNGTTTFFLIDLSRLLMITFG